MDDRHELPPEARFEQARRLWQLEQDSGIAYELQQREFSSHFSHNRFERRSIRQNVQTAKQLQTDEVRRMTEEEAARMRMRSDMERNDEHVAREMSRENEQEIVQRLVAAELAESQLRRANAREQQPAYSGGSPFPNSITNANFSAQRDAETRSAAHNNSGRQEVLNTDQNARERAALRGVQPPLVASTPPSTSTPTTDEELARRLQEEEERKYARHLERSNKEKQLRKQMKLLRLANNQLSAALFGVTDVDGVERAAALTMNPETRAHKLAQLEANDTEIAHILQQLEQLRARRPEQPGDSASRPHSQAQSQPARAAPSAQSASQAAKSSAHAQSDRRNAPLPPPPPQPASQPRPAPAAAHPANAPHQAIQFEWPPSVTPKQPPPGDARPHESREATTRSPSRPAAPMQLSADPPSDPNASRHRNAIPTSASNGALRQPPTQIVASALQRESAASADKTRSDLRRRSVPNANTALLGDAGFTVVELEGEPRPQTRLSPVPNSGSIDTPRQAPERAQPKANAGSSANSGSARSRSQTRLDRASLAPSPAPGAAASSQVTGNPEIATTPFGTTTNVAALIDPVYRRQREQQKPLPHSATGAANVSMNVSATSRAHALAEATAAPTWNVIAGQKRVRSRSAGRSTSKQRSNVLVTTDID